MWPQCIRFNYHLVPLEYVFLWCSEKSNFKQKISTRVNQKNIISLWKEYDAWRWFKFWPIKNIFRKLKANASLFIACLQNYRKWLSFATFRRVRSNSKGVFYFSWQNKYSNLKATGHIKPKCFFWTKLLDKVLLTKYLISVASTLKGIINLSLCNRWNTSYFFII